MEAGNLTIIVNGTCEEIFRSGKVVFEDSLPMAIIPTEQSNKYKLSSNGDELTICNVSAQRIEVVEYCDGTYLVLLARNVIIIANETEPIINTTPQSNTNDTITIDAHCISFYIIICILSYIISQ